MTSERRLHVLGIVITVAVHLGVVGTVAAMRELEAKRAERATAAPPKLNAIQGALAIREKKARGQKSKQPQKQAAAPKPDGPPTVKLDRNPDENTGRKVEEKKPTPAENYADDYEKARQRAQRLAAENTEEEASGDGGGGGEANPRGEGGDDDENRAGRPDGVDHGTAIEASGDPYVGDLLGRIGQLFEAPKMITQPRKAQACVRLSRGGRIVDYVIAEKSGDPRFDGAVEKALIKARNSIDLDDVPGHLVPILVKGYGCFPLTNAD